MITLENFLTKFLGPIANWMDNNRFFSALSESFMRTTPITLGAAILMIIGNFPIPIWLNWLAEVGLTAHFNAVIGATINAISLFIVFNFAYIYARNAQFNPLASGLIAMGSFLILMPQTVSDLAGNVILNTQGNPVEVYQTLFTGGTGLLVAIIVGYVSSLFYVFLNKKKIVVKMADSVPPNVSESLSPSILTGIIFIFFFIVRVGLSYTPFDNLFYLVFGFIQQPLQNITGSPITIILVFTIANLLWFFGIHPNLIYGIIMPIMIANNQENINAFRDGLPLPFLTMAVLTMVCGSAFGGQGATYGLIISMFTAKSQRYKQLVKLAGPPGIFNVNEPLIFGAPLMLNSDFFIPMVSGPLIMGSAAWLLIKLLNFTELNPLIALPWTTPSVVVMGLQGGIKYLLIFLLVFFINIILWFPFFKIADKRALAEEQAFKDTQHK